MKTYLRISPKDNVAVALAPLPSGTTVELDGLSLILKEEIPQGHKFALSDIPSGTQIIKYGYPIGIANEQITCGSWVHTHNIRTGLGDLLSYTYNRQVSALAPHAGTFLSGIPPQQRKSGREKRAVDHPHRRLCEQYRHRHRKKGTAAGIRNCRGGRSLSPSLRVFPDGR